MNSVTEELQAVPGVTSVTVALNSGGTSEVRVVSDVPLEESAVRNAVDEAGYRLESAAPWTSR